jgi:hypothetical protein
VLLVGEAGEQGQPARALGLDQAQQVAQGVADDLGGEVLLGDADGAGEASVTPRLWIALPTTKVTSTSRA